MRETLLSNCEQNFVNKAIHSGIRLDGRGLLEPRSVKIYFGSNWGCCIVSLGQTRCIAQVTCDIQQPRPSRPNEGMIHLNVDISSLAAEHFESGRQTDAVVLINRQLEKCLKDSKCIDLEALCIVAAKKVWNLRVDINVINHDGNLVDCASIAAIAALSHFHRPDVTSTGDHIIVHPFSEKDPLPLTIYHYPVCVTFTTFENGSTVMDPTYLEERIGVAHLTMGINSYRELCSLNFDYVTKTLTVEDVISAVSSSAANYAAKLVEQVKAAVYEDREARYKKLHRNTNTFKECIRTDTITSMLQERISIRLQKPNKLEKMETSDNESEERSCIIKSGVSSAELYSTLESKPIGEGGPSTWVTSDSSDTDDNIQIVDAPVKEKPKVEEIDLHSDSEEEVTQSI